MLLVDAVETVLLAMFTDLLILLILVLNDDPYLFGYEVAFKVHQLFKIPK